MRVYLASSLSARRAWIEIESPTDFVSVILVALRKESVDRNLMTSGDVTAPSTVALRKESVDRNSAVVFSTSGSVASLSARRAWIEIYPLKSEATLGAGRSPQGERG